MLAGFEPGREFDPLQDSAANLGDDAAAVLEQDHISSDLVHAAGIRSATVGPQSLAGTKRFDAPERSQS